MVKLTGKYLKEQRLKKNKNAAQLAGMMGYETMSKGMNRTTDLERENIIIPEVLKRIDGSVFYSIKVHFIAVRVVQVNPEIVGFTR